LKPLRAVLFFTLTCLLAATVAVSARAAAPPPGTRIDLKVLLATPSANDAVYASWKAALQREGVPFDTYTESAAAPLNDAKLADYTAGHAKYNAVILAYGDMLTSTEQAALTKFEKTFGVRQISDNVASAAHGLTLVSSGEQGGQTGTLTANGKLVFPYLNGNVPIATPSFGYQATPAAGANFTTLVAGPNGSAYVGINTRADGTQEMVDTVPGSATESQSQLLRHGMIAWATGGVYLGTQRNYLELQIDDTFLGDDAWIPAGGVTNPAGRTCVPAPATTSSCPEDQIQLAPADVDTASKWMRDNGVRLDMVFNGGGTDPGGVLAAFKPHASEFGWINHTWDHPNLDCSTAPFISSQITRNTDWAKANGLPTVATELVTGEHSGLANTLPGNPGTIDPPSFSTAEARTTAGATLAAGSYDYGITGTTAKGETNPSVTTVTAAAGQGVALSWEAVCHSTSYKVYRRATGTTAWSLLGTINQPATAFNDAGPLDVTYTDTGAAGTAATPPTANGAGESPYGQNPSFVAALDAAGVKYTATDASKAYPNPPTAAIPATTVFAAGASFLDGDVRAVPRYPTNIYYNTETQAQQLDEYNYLYNASRGCVPIPNVTTCNVGDVTWQQLLDSESSVMLRHVLGNDPRPHYFHEANISSSTVSGGAPFYALANQVLAQYKQAFNTPLVQLTPTQIGDELARQDAWSAAVAAGTASAYLQDGKVHVTTAGALDVPLTGTNAGEPYGGMRSGWARVNGSAEFALGDPLPQPPAGGDNPGPQPGGGSQPGAGGGSQPGGGGTKPATLRLTKLSLSPRRFSPSGRKAGTMISWTATGKGALDAKVQLLQQGRRVGKACKAPTNANRRKRSCTRAVDVGVIKLAVTAGTGRTRFTGRLGGKALKAGNYQLVAGSQSVKFTVTTRKVKHA
jgi:hypothetical protein